MLMGNLWLFIVGTVVVPEIVSSSEVTGVGKF